MNTEIMFRALIAASNKHLSAPDAKAFAFAIRESEDYLSSISPQYSPTQKPEATPGALIPYHAPKGSPWPEHYAPPDDVLAACIAGATEGKVMERIKTRQFATRHALHRLQDEGWLTAGRPHEKASYTYTTSAQSYAHMPVAATLRRGTLTDVAALRSMLPTTEDQACDIELTMQRGFLGADVSAYRADILAGSVAIGTAPDISYYWPAVISPEPPPEDEELPTE